MRCYNCGWNNPEEVSRCEKCNQPLKQPTPLSMQLHIDKEPVRCKMCGNTIESSLSTCPNCGSPIISGNANDVLKQAQSLDNRATSYYNQSNLTLSQKTATMSNSSAAKATVIASAGGLPTSIVPTSAKATIIATADTIASYQNVNLSEKKESIYNFVCLDAPLLGTRIQITSPQPLDLSSGTIVLLGSLRYKVE